MLAWLEGGGRADATYERGEVSGLTLLMGAARYGHERVVELLLRHGAEINLQDSNGGTALMLAARNGHERVVELLIRRGAEINLQNSDGGTALMIAAFFNHPAVVRRLLRAGGISGYFAPNGCCFCPNAFISILLHSYPFFTCTCIRSRVSAFSKIHRHSRR